MRRQLFIDESGDERAGDWLVVGGVLLHGEPAVVEEELRLAYAVYFPGVPYPPHATEQATASGRLALMLRADPSELRRAETQLVAEAVAALARDPSPATRAYLAQAEMKRAPFRRDRESVEGWLRSRAPAVYRRLRALVEEDREGQRRLLGRLRQLGLLDVVAAATPVVDAAPTATPTTAPGTPHGPYLEGLRCCFERLLALTDRARPTPMPLDLIVCRRDISRFGYPLLPLTVPDVWAQLAKAERAVGKLGGVSVESVRVVAYDQAAPAGVVLADVVTNALRRLVLGGAPTLSWQALETAFVERLAAPLKVGVARWSPAPALPTVATDGAAAKAVCAALRREPLPPALEGAHPQQWQLEQASAWIAAATRGGVA